MSSGITYPIWFVMIRCYCIRGFEIRFGVNEKASPNIFLIFRLDAVKLDFQWFPVEKI